MPPSNSSQTLIFAEEVPKEITAAKTSFETQSAKPHMSQPPAKSNARKTFQWTTCVPTLQLPICLKIKDKQPSLERCLQKQEIGIRNKRKTL
jgi:hypothetical protein